MLKFLTGSLIVPYNTNMVLYHNMKNNLFTLITAFKNNKLCFNGLFIVMNITRKLVDVILWFN